MVVNGRHRVIQVRQMRRPRLKDGLCLFVVGIGMGDRNRAERFRLPGECRRARELRRHVHDPHQTAADLIKGPEGLKIRKLQIGAVLGALFLLRKEGALHVNAHDAGTVRRPVFGEAHGRLKGRRKRLVGQGHGRGGKAGHAAFCQMRGHAAQALPVPVRDVRPRGAVGVDVDQARDHPGALQIEGPRRGFSGGIDVGKAPALHAEAAGDEALSGQKQLRIRKNSHLRPPAGWPRRCSGRHGGPSHPAA